MFANIPYMDPMGIFILYPNYYGAILSTGIDVPRARDYEMEARGAAVHH